ncbi:MAG: restriction endonuclease subunit S [Proteobacteria bacterium]|jgi:type I restriction enzyme S subunit|nr:restriction endonuclease subunit S [Pseudomonadota bacterium]
MAGEWQRHEVSKLIEAGTLLIGDGYRAKNDELGDHGLPFARAGNINDGFQFKDADHFPEGNLARVGNKVSRPGDVVFTSKGTVGRFAFVRPSTQRFVYSPQLCFWRALDASVIEPGFLFYWMFGREFFVQFKGVAGQTDMAEYVSLTDQRRMHITLPPIHEQRAIAHILGTLDDKIELNRRMSETLEAMARALFKAWFVDFEPVRAKHALSKVEGIEGRWQRGQSLPGLPAHLYDLFPDRLVDSSLGAIPQGWEVKIIDDLAEIIGGSTPSTVQPAYWDDGIHCWATPKDLSALKAPVLLNTERRVTDAGLAQISSGLLPKGTVLLSSRAPIGYLAIAEVPVAINQGFVAMKPRTGVPNLFLLLWARAAHEDILARANGSTFLEISKANFRPLRVVGPPLSVLNAFDRIARPMYERIVFIERESNALATLRDTLLPMLISGELRLKNAAWLAEVAA